MIDDKLFETEHNKYVQDQNIRKTVLWRALNSRVLTLEEIKEVAQFGTDLFVMMHPAGAGVSMGSSNMTTQEANQKFQSGLLIQQLLRQASEQTTHEQMPGPGPLDSEPTSAGLRSHDSTDADKQ